MLRRALFGAPLRGDPHAVRRLLSQKPGYLLNDGKVDGKQHRVNRQLQPHARPAELSSNRIYFGNAYSPVVGDIRVSWQAVTADRVSVVGQQRGNSFGPFPTRAGDDILLVCCLCLVLPRQHGRQAKACAVGSVQLAHRCELARRHARSCCPRRL